MTLNNSTRSVEYPGAGTVGPFAVPFKVFDKSHLIVTTMVDATGVVTTLTADDYEFTGAGLAAGSVTLDAVVAVGTTLKIRRAPPLTQLLSIRNQGPYDPARVEDRLDLMVMQVQGTVDDTEAMLAALEENLQAQLDNHETRITDLETIVATLQEAQEGALIPVPVLSDISVPTEDGGFLEWSAGLSYEYQVATDPGFAEEDLVPALRAVQIENPTELTSLIRFLESETTYYVRIRAVGLSLDGNEFPGDWSNTVSFTTAAAFSAQGGDSVTYDEATGYSTHVFDTDGDFEVLSGTQAVRALIVAAGGMGGGTNGSGNSCGGGGGGGVKEFFPEDWPAIDPDVYPVVVGAAATVPAANNVGVNGGDSSFNGQTATGGGFGGSLGNIEGDGGSGGGSLGITNGAGGRGKTNQGNDGGGGYTVGGVATGGGGGGGADRLVGEGERATGGVSGGKGGDGGPGYVSDIEGADAYYGAGGGGARPCDAFGVTADSTPGAGGTGGGGAGSNGNSQGAPATGVGCGGGGAHGNNRGGLGSNGRVVIKYFGRAADIDPIDPPIVLHGPIDFSDCERSHVVDGVTILCDSNAKTDTGIYPDYREYWCDGSGRVRSSRWDPAYSGEFGATGNDGILVFRFSEPIKYIKLTREVTPDVDGIPSFVLCDDYSVRPDPGSGVPGSTEDGSIIGLKTIVHPPTNLAAEETVEINYPAGFLTLVIFQSESLDPKRTSFFKDVYFTKLTD